MKRITLCIMVLGFMITSCKKDTPSNPDGSSGNKTCRIKTVTEDSPSGETTSYEYNADGWISKVTYPNDQYEVFTYTAGKLVIEKFDAGGNNIPGPGDEYFVNTDGFITKEIRKFPDNTKRTTIYTYSSDGYLITAEEWDTDGNPDGIFKNTVENGNVTRMETIWIPGKDTTVLTCTFLAKENVGGIRQFPWEDFNPLARMYGKPNKNLVNTLILKGSVGTYSYQMEGDNVKQYTMVETGSPNSLVRLYTYDCK